MKALNIVLENWGMGTVILVVFGLVCIVIIAVIYSMSQSGKKKNDTE